MDSLSFVDIGGRSSGAKSQTSQGPQRPSPTLPKCAHGLGAGIVAGGAAEAGVLGAGAGVQASTGLGGFLNASSGASLGWFASGGAVAYAGSNTVGAPKQSGNGPTIIGAFAGAGYGAFITNAGTAAQLTGPFLTLSANLGIFVKGSFQFSIDSHWTFIASFTSGPGAGASGSGYMTTTTAAGPACIW